MYIPKSNLISDRKEVIEFIRRFSFGTIITAENNIPVATHLPFVVKERDNDLFLVSHFARANDHWESIESKTVLTIFTEPHSYISPSHYDKVQNVPTWNYVSVHVYGTIKIIEEYSFKIKALEDLISTYEKNYLLQWNTLKEDYKSKMAKGIVVFEVKVDEIQGKKKLSQNKTNTERKRIISTLKESEQSNEAHIAEYMQREDDRLKS